MFDTTFKAIELVVDGVRDQVLAVGNKLASALLSAPWGWAFIALVFGIVASIKIIEFLAEGDLIEFLVDLAKIILIGAVSIVALARWSDLSQVPLKLMDFAQGVVIGANPVEAVVSASNKLGNAFHRDFGEKAKSKKESVDSSTFEAEMGFREMLEKSQEEGGSSIWPTTVLVGFFSDLIAHLFAVFAYGIALIGLFIALVYMLVAKVQAWVAIAFMPVGIIAFIVDSGRILGATIRMMLTGMGTVLIVGLLIIATADGYANAISSLVTQGALADGKFGSLDFSGGLSEITIAILSVLYALFIITLTRNSVTWSTGIFNSVGFKLDGYSVRGIGIKSTQPPPKGSDSSPPPKAAGSGSPPPKAAGLGSPLPSPKRGI